ncbi:MAG TPA: LamG-like jellyroll fold domain-containing protein [Methylomirabilota bacterium]|nr:LamG-like jellyroll fold domain-containing protein [Methylomirabilota bacterium]
MPATFVNTSKQYLSLVTTGSGTGAVVTQGLVLDFTSGSVLTVAAWVKLKDTNLDYCVLAKNQDSYANGAYVLRYNKDTNMIDWTVNTYTGCWTASVAAPANVTTASSGNLIIAQWNNTGCSVSVNNGAFVSATTQANIAPENKQFTGTAHDSVAIDQHQFTIGYDPTNPNATYMNGQIGSVGVWNRLLTATEMTTLYNSGTPLLFTSLAGAQGGCAAFWDLDLDALDDNQFGYNLTNNASVAFAAAWV